MVGAWEILVVLPVARVEPPLSSRGLDRLDNRHLGCWVVEDVEVV